MGITMEKTKGWQWRALSVIVAALVTTIAVTAVVLAHSRRMQRAAQAPAQPARPPVVVNRNFSQALQLSLLFLDVQKSGQLPSNQPILWRGDSALRDGSDVGLDLSGGLYDAGDHVKFGLPMAFTATLLAWSVLEYGPVMDAAQQLSHATESIRWVTDYLIKAHPSSEEFYYQVGDPKTDHSCWERAENMDISRPSYKLDPSTPGTEVAAESAAALAAASLVFRSSDSAYADLLLTHAKQLFVFGDSYRVSYSISNPSVQAYYNSTGFGDELLWAATWLFYATGETTYLQYVTGTNGLSYAEWGQAPSWFSWDNKLAGVQVLLARLQMLQPPQNVDHNTTMGLQQYKTTADALMCALLPQSPTATGDRTKGGLLWVTEWNPIQHAVDLALLALFYSDYLVTAKIPTLSCSGSNFTAQQLHSFAASQADYILGANPMQISYLVGYGTEYPKLVHHRDASIPWGGSTVYGCKTGFMWFSSPSSNPNVCTGGLVGGPFKNDTYTDSRDNVRQNEPTTYNSAGMAGLVAGLAVEENYQVPNWTERLQ